MIATKNLVNVLLLMIAGHKGAWAQDTLAVPYVPTDEKVVRAMLDIADVKKKDYVVDLGCGDGRIVITAARRRGASGMGVDNDPERIREAKANAEKAGVSDRARFALGDLFETDLHKATVITLYLLPWVNLKLRPKLLALKPGTRIVSNAFDMGDWKPDKKRKVNGYTIYFWTVPAK